LVVELGVIIDISNEILTEISILRVGKFNRDANICRKLKLENVFDLTRLFQLVD